MRLDIHEFLITARFDEMMQCRYAEFRHVKSDFGLSIPIPAAVVDATPGWNAWVAKKFNTLVEPLVRACIEEEENVARQAS